MSNNDFFETCKRLVANYYGREIDEDNIYIVWCCKILQNNKALLSTTLKDSMYFEITYNGDKDEFELSYRVKGINGNYVPCICKGLMIRNQHGEPEYFGGVLLIHEEEAN